MSVLNARFIASATVPDPLIAAAPIDDRAANGLAVHFEQRTFDRLAQALGQHVAAGLAANGSDGEAMIRDACETRAAQFGR